MSQGIGVSGGAPPIISDKVCKKCKQKVINSFIKCLDCDISYHKSCFTGLGQKARNNHELISESEMKCENRQLTTPLSPFPQDLESYQIVVSKLQEENEKLKAEIKLMRASNNYSKGDFTSDVHAAIIKTISDNIKSEMDKVVSQLERSIYDNVVKILQKPVIRPPLDDNSKLSYKEAANKNRLIIKPKVEENPGLIKNILQKAVQPEELKIGINHVRQLKNGGIEIAVTKNEDIVKLQEELKTKLDEKYTVSNVKTRKPKIKITGLDDFMDEDLLKRCIKSQNTCLEDAPEKWKFIVFKKMKKRYFVIFEVDAESFSKIIGLGNKLFIKWSECTVFEYFNIHRCYKCGGFNHNSAQCK